jgi:dipeptidyl aminopeptidase/acylaminoacyl peptidase
MSKATLLALALPMLSFAQLPPLIDRDLLFGEIEIAGAQLSPDGKFMSFMKPHNGARNIWVKRTNEPFDAARPVTAESRRPIPSHFWSRDSKFILFVKDNAGDENFNVYAVDPAAAPAADNVPPARNLTDRKGVRAQIYAVPRALPGVIFLGLNDRDQAWHDLYRLELATGKLTLLRENKDRVTRWIFDNAGKLRLASRVAANGTQDILRVDADKLTPIYSCRVLEQCDPGRFDKENKKIYLVRNDGDARNFSELALLDAATGAAVKVESDPLGQVDFGAARFSDLTDELVATSYTSARRRLYFKSKAHEADYKFLESKLPNREINFPSASADESLWIVSANADVEPGEVYLYNRKAKSLELQYRMREKLPRASLSPMRDIEYPSSDGLKIPAYLTLPKGLPEKDLPLVVFPHGGPWGRDYWRYDTFAQFLANRGYAVLQPNFRASTGYGKSFLNAGNRQWGRTMQDDLTWGVKHLVAKGIVNPKRVAIAGISYGGYATLAGVAYTPDLYAAGVPIVAPANLITLLESIPPYWEAVRSEFALRMGDLTTPEGRKDLTAMSPVAAAKNIRAPLLVVQGANDPRVKKRESDQVVVAVRDRGLPVEYLVAPDEGHGFARPINNLAMIAAMEKFLAKHIDGRYQADMPAAVAKRLAEITVDPKTVTLPPELTQ